MLMTSTVNIFIAASFYVNFHILLNLQNAADGNDFDEYLTSLVDDDELALISTQVADLKSRLYIDAQSKIGYDWGTLGVFVKENLSKLKEGLDFYGEGTKMLFSDILYAWRLVVKAALGGYTLQPREVNSMRRLAKDVLTLIPFTIILIIPLTPIGHVLVFSFIQRFFPDFFPSFYTDKRQNLRKLYSDIERKSDEYDDLLAPTATEAWSLQNFGNFQPSMQQSFLDSLKKIVNTTAFSTGSNYSNSNTMRK